MSVLEQADVLGFYSRDIDLYASYDWLDYSDSENTAASGLAVDSLSFAEVKALVLEGHKAMPFNMPRGLNALEDNINWRDYLLFVPDGAGGKRLWFFAAQCFFGHSFEYWDIYLHYESQLKLDLEIELEEKPLAVIVDEMGLAEGSTFEQVLDERVLDWIDGAYCATEDFLEPLLEYIECEIG